jgi:aminoglycoside phosphotransferase (APT) family kinase protein
MNQAFPDAALKSCHRVPGEHSSLHYYIELDNLMVARVKLYTSNDADRAASEIKLLQMVTSETGVPVPRVLHYAQQLPHEIGAERDDIPWAMLTWLPGQSFAEVIHHMDGWELESVGYEMGRYLGHIHQLSLDQFGCLFRDGPHNHVSEQAYIVAQAKEWIDRCAEVQALSEATLDALEKAFVHTDLLNRRQACLTHGEFALQHVMVEHGATGYHVTGILDFAHAQASGPELDMVLLLEPGFQEMPSFQKGFLDGYAESGELPAAFWDRLRLYGLFTSLFGLVRANEGNQTGRAKEYAEQIDYLLFTSSFPTAGNS